MSGFIYVGSPYSHPERDVRHLRYLQAAGYTAQLLRDGRSAFSPIVHGHTLAELHNLPRDFGWWRSHSLSMLARAASLHVLMLDGWQESVGLLDEIDVAGRLGLPVVYVEGWQ